MPFDLNESVVATLRQRLEDELPAQIDALNAESGALVELEVPAAVLDYIPAPSELVTFPTVGVEDGRTTFKDDIGSSVTGMIELVAVVFLIHADQQTLARQLRRYSRALTAVCLRGRTLPPGYLVRLKETVPGPSLDTSEPERVRTWTSFTAVVVEVETDDS